MARTVSRASFFKQYTLWLDACLKRFNERYDENRKYHQDNAPVDYNTQDLVEFTEDGDAYPHSNWGTGHVSHAVVAWENSEHYVV